MTIPSASLTAESSLDPADSELRDKRRRRAVVAFVLLLSLAAALGIDFLVNRGGGIGPPAFMAPIERSLRSFFRQRSPGERTAANLQLKRQQIAASERALAKVRGPAEAAEEPAEGFPEDQLVDLGGGPDMTAPSFEEALLLTPPDGPPICCANVPDGGIVILGPDQPPAPGVPEPATWLMMLLGFAMTGAGLRRQRQVGRPLACR